MKNLIKVTFLFLCFYFVSYIADAQQQTKKIKFGHIDSGELLSMMPGRDSAQKKLQEYAATLSQQLKTMQAELDT